jgi:hypothetical protein
MVFLRSLLIGQWYRLDTDEFGQQLSEFAVFFPDGRFEFTFSTLNNVGAVEHQEIEMGDWGLVGDIHFTLTKNELVDEVLYPAELENEDNYHAYHVLQLTNKTFEYRHIITNEVFIMRRVVDNIGFC